jgi:hypothetical protein
LYAVLNGGFLTGIFNTASYSVGDPEHQELAWSDKYQLGDLTVYACDIGPIPGITKGPAVDGEGKPFVAMLGMRALRNMRLFIDRERAQVVTQTTSPLPPHNRVGAHFIRTAMAT